MTSRVLETEADREMWLRLLKAHTLPCTVTVVKGKRRSDRQNRLQRQWCNDVAEQLGDRTAEEVRGYCKLHFGVPILRAENEDFAAAYDKFVRPLPYEQKLALMMDPFDFNVTRLMTTKQKTQYLDLMNRHFAEQGVILTDPEGLRYAA